MRHGGVVPLVGGLGVAATSDWSRETLPGSTAFASGYAEDLAALAAAGVGDVRIPIDWSRLEPTEGRIDRTWLEWYGQVLDAASGAGLGVWACLWEGPLPAWFSDAGGFGEERAAARHWPRFVDRVAETFGDRLAGWVPFDRPAQRIEAAWLLGTRPPRRRDPQRHAETVLAMLVAWRDTWRLLRGGPPVATALGLERIDPEDESPAARTLAAEREEHRFELWGRALRDGVADVPGLAERDVPDLAGALDVLGIVLRFDSSIRVDDPARAEADVERWVERNGESLRRLAEAAPERPVALTLALRREDADGREAGVHALARVAREAAADGIDVTAMFVEPAIDGLLSREREDTDASRALAGAG